MDPIRMAGQGGPTTESYRFDDIVVDAGAHTLTRGGERQTVEPKAFAVLLLLLRRPGELIGRDELLDAVWGHRHVTPGVLTRVIAQLRHALGDDSQRPRYIQTQHALGYRFIGLLRPDDAPDPTETPTVERRPVPESDASPEPEPPLSLSPEAANDARLTTGDGLWPAEHGVAPPSHRSLWRWLAVSALMLVVVLGTWLFLERRNAPLQPADASIAVLPFTTLGNDKQGQYFAEGLAVEMHSALAGVHGLKVAAWMSPGALARGSDVKSIGERMGVSTVLDASVRREGQRMRVSARLTDTRSGFTLWSRTYDRDVSDVFATQGEIANEVATALVGVLPDAGESLRKRLAPTQNVAAFDAYLKGLQALLHGKGEDREKTAQVYFDQALVHDKGFARAQAGLCRLDLWRFESHRDAAAFDDARLACLRAENMDPTVGEVALALGDLYRVKGDLDKATQYYRSIEHDPANRANALVGLAKVDRENNRMDLAMAHFSEALKASPGNAHIYAEMGYQQYAEGQVPQAVESLRRASELQPDDADIWNIYGSLLMVAGDNDKAARAFERSLAIEPIEAVLSNLGTLKYQKREYAAAVALYRQAVELNPAHFQVWGNLGDALLADPTTAPQAREVYTEAATRAQSYVGIKADDAKALAALGWFKANLGERAAALDLVMRSESLGNEKAEVAYYNAETLALLGQTDQASQRIDAARAEGMADVRISTNAIFIRSGLTKSPATSRQ